MKLFIYRKKIIINIRKMYIIYILLKMREKNKKKMDWKLCLLILINVYNIKAEVKQAKKNLKQ